MFSEELNSQLLARVDDVDMNLAAPTTTILFTVPTNFQCVVERVIVKPAAAGFTTLGAANDVDFGKTGAPTDWSNAYDPSGLINGDLVLTIDPEVPALPPLYDAGEVFQMVNNAAAAAGALVDVLVIGRLIVA